MRHLLLLLVLCIGCSKPSVDPWSNGFNNGFGLQTKDITEMYVDYIEQWKTECASSFDKAEKEIYKTSPEDEIVRPHEDPNKCPCKGSGIIIQGDGHKTVCPFHGKSQQEKMENSSKDVTIKHFRR